jgi:hypothetical protein
VAATIQDRDANLREANARRSGRTHTLHLCYELANEFAELYLNYGSRSGAKVRPKR